MVTAETLGLTLLALPVFSQIVNASLHGVVRAFLIELPCPLTSTLASPPRRSISGFLAANTALTVHGKTFHDTIIAFPPLHLNLCRQTIGGSPTIPPHCALVVLRSASGSSAVEARHRCSSSRIDKLVSFAFSSLLSSSTGATAAPSSSAPGPLPDVFKMRLLRITPDRALEFPIVLYSSINADLSLENTSDGSVAFKIKTTAPKNYLVRPSSGIIQAGETCKVSIILQPLTEEPKHPCSDRFMVQATEMFDSSPLPKDFWQVVDKSLVEDQRLSVIYRTPEGVYDEGSNANDGVSGGVSGSVGVGIVGGGGASSAGAGGASSSLLSSAGGGGAMMSTASIPGGASQSSVVAVGGSGGGGSGSGLNDSNLKAKYEELVEYCLAVEKQKNLLEKENETLKSRLSTSKSGAWGAGVGGDGGLVANSTCSSRLGFEIWHLPIYLIVAGLLWFFFSRSDVRAA